MQYFPSISPWPSLAQLFSKSWGIELLFSTQKKELAWLWFGSKKRSAIPHFWIKVQTKRWFIWVWFLIHIYSHLPWWEPPPLPLPAMRCLFGLFGPCAIFRDWNALSDTCTCRVEWCLSSQHHVRYGLLCFYIQIPSILMYSNYTISSFCLQHHTSYFPPSSTSCHLQRGLETERAVYEITNSSNPRCPSPKHYQSCHPYPLPELPMLRTGRTTQPPPLWDPVTQSQSWIVRTFVYHQVREVFYSQLSPWPNGIILHHPLPTFVVGVSQRRRLGRNGLKCIGFFGYINFIKSDINFWNSEGVL